MLKYTNRSTLIVTAFALLAVSCGSSSPTSGSTPATATGVDTDASVPALPVDVSDSGVADSAAAESEGAHDFSDLPPIDREVIARAGVSFSDDLIDLEYQVVSALVTDCMDERGFEFDRGLRPAAVDPVGQRAWHPLDEEYASQYGYRAAPRPPSAMNERANSDTAFSEALFGREGAPGCFGAVADFVNDETGSVQFAESVSALRQTPLESMSAWLTTDQYQARVGEWSDCMASQGYSFRTPSDALSSAGDGGQASSAEINLRLTDIECDRSVGLTAARSEYETDVVSRWADENAEAIRESGERADQVAQSLIDVQGTDRSWG